MSLRLRFILFVILVHVVVFGLALFILPTDKWVFLIAEIILLGILFFSIHLYRAFLKPLNLIASGVETIRDKDFQSKFLPTGQPELDELIDVYNRMIDQLREERTKQREQHYFLERLIHASPTGVLILDLDDKVSLVNPIAARLLGCTTDVLLGRSCNDLPGPLGEALTGMEPGEKRVISLSGMQTYRCQKSHFLDRGFHRHFLLIEELTKEILDTQKKAYTSVIRMMSHEVNNTVGAVNSILESSLAFAAQLTDGDREEFTSVAHVAINRNNGLNSFMTRLASVVRVPEPDKVPYDLVNLLKSIQVLTAAEAQERGIEVKLTPCEQPVMAAIDVDQIEQVLINIVRNAMESIENDGTISMQVTSAPPCITIADNGRGISEEVRKQMFTPFYTNKRNGHGVGLTLTREVLLNHGCRFNLEPGLNGGAVFWIEFESGE
ncbi:MAG TPA: ATP-binding protein [candidate division Zixibacteria bacterium]|nr:ATP-binding protein [candidate division Zixibacteria bacterium]